MHRLPPEIIYEIATYIAPLSGIYVDGRLPLVYEQIAAMGCRQFIDDTMIRAWKRYSLPTQGEWQIVVWCPFTFEYYPIDDLSEINAPTHRHFTKHYARFATDWHTESRKGSGKWMVASLVKQPYVGIEAVIFDANFGCLVAPNGNIYEIIASHSSPVLCRHRLVASKKDHLSI